MLPLRPLLLSRLLRSMGVLRPAAAAAAATLEITPLPSMPPSMSHRSRLLLLRIPVGGKPKNINLSLDCYVTNEHQKKIVNISLKRCMARVLVSFFL